MDASGQRKYVIDEDGENMVVYTLDEGIGRQAAGWKEGFATARARGQIRVATDAIWQRFGHTRRFASEPEQGSERPPVTAQIREHIAGLRSLLGARPANQDCLDIRQKKRIRRSAGWVTCRLPAVVGLDHRDGFREIHLAVAIDFASIGAW